MINFITVTIGLLLILGLLHYWTTIRSQEKVNDQLESLRRDIIDLGKQVEDAIFDQED